MENIEKEWEEYLIFLDEFWELIEMPPKTEHHIPIVIHGIL